MIVNMISEIINYFQKKAKFKVKIKEIKRGEEENKINKNQLKNYKKKEKNIILMGLRNNIIK